MKVDGWLLDVRFDGDEALLWVRTSDGRKVKLWGDDCEILNFDGNLDKESSFADPAR